jgi:hypothetical protein
MGNENSPPTHEHYDIRIARDGSWWHEGGRIGRESLVRLFASVLKRDEHGDYWLETPAERGRITLEDAPFVAVELQREGEGEHQVLRFRTNLDRWVEAGPAHALVMREGTEGETKPYIQLENGLEAACVRAVYYELMELAVEHDGRTGLWSGGMFFPFDVSGNKNG